MLNRRLLRATLAAGFFAVVFCAAFSSASSAALDDLDNIRFEGKVRDSSGALIPGALVIARHLATGTSRAAVADGEGRFRIFVTEPGAYSIKASAEGFKEEEQTDIAVMTGRTIVIHFKLAPSGMNELMTVDASSAPLVDSLRSVVGETVTRDEIEGLPISERNPLQLVFLLGGVAEAPLSTAGLGDEGSGQFVRGTPEEAGIFSLTGAQATSNNITIDGLDNNDDRSARERISLNPESVAELQVITNQYAAEYGRASGGRVNIRTRGGANRFRAEAYFFFEDESLNANTFFRNSRGLKRIAQQKLREGVTFSGPIRPQKYFFFSSYERNDISDFAEVNAFVPVEANPLFPLPPPNKPGTAEGGVALLSKEISTPESRNLVNARGDFNFSESHNCTLRFDALRGANKRGFPGGSRLPETILIEGRDSNSVSLLDNFVISGSAINQARIQISQLLPRSESRADSAGVVIEEPSRIVAGAFTGSESSPAFARTERRIQVQDHLAISSPRHHLKFGLDAQIVRSTFADLFATGGQYTFDSVGDFLANRPSRFLQRFNTESRLSNDVIGLFIQDEWKVRPGLTISLGTRWDGESVIDDRNNFSPRLSVAWDPFGASGGAGSKRSDSPGNTVVRAGFGIFYNRALLRTIDDFSLGKTSITVDSSITPEILAGIKFPSPVTSAALIERFGVSETAFLRRVSPDLEVPYTIQTGLGVERRLNDRFIATVDYVFTRGAHLWRESNINAPALPAGFSNFTEFLLSRDFDNRENTSGVRPISGASADVIRFDLSATTSTSPGAISTDGGLRVLTLGLNAPRSANIRAALNAIRFLRPDPSLTQVELLEATGNSFYHGGIFSVRWSMAPLASFRAAYTISKLIDEGTTNTASPQDLLDRRAERALSLQDQRHRFTFSGLFQIPIVELDLAPAISIGSSRPFNIGAGFDRNLDDIETDRPAFIEPIDRPVWRRPGSGSALDTKAALALSSIGSSGNLPRNYGRGPSTQSVNLRVSRALSVNERIRIRTALDAFNVFNSTVFSFGSEFINRDDADFLVPRRTQRPRTIQLSLKVIF